MYKLSKVAQVAAALGAVALAGTAVADTVQIDSFTYAGTMTSHIAKSDPVMTSGTYGAGEMTGFLNGNSFQTFCVDIFESFPGWGNPSSSYSQVSGVSQWGAAKANDVNRLFTNWYGSVNNGETSTAFQLALWEIVYESTANYALSGVNGGTFTASGGTATAAAYSTANTWLNNLGSLGSTYTQVDVLKSGPPGYQDFVVVSTVPEPEAYLLALVSIGVLVGARRMKKGRDAASASLA